MQKIKEELSLTSTDYVKLMELEAEKKEIEFQLDSAIIRVLELEEIKEDYQ